MNYTPEYYQARQSQDYRSGAQANAAAAKKAPPADGEERSLFPVLCLSVFLQHYVIAQNGTSTAERATECVFHCFLAYRKKLIGH